MRCGASADSEACPQDIDGFPVAGIWRWGSQGTFSGEVSPEKLPPRCSTWREGREAGEVPRFYKCLSGHDIRSPF